jgi:biotin operon repressor
VIQTAEQASTVLQPERLKLLELLSEPDSASGLASKLGVPRQRVNYHVQLLEKQGFLELAEERRKGNCTERLLRRTAKTYLISPAVLGRLGENREQARDRFSAAYLISVAARAIRDLAVLGWRSQRAKKRLATLTLETEVRFASTSDRTAFAEELANTLARLSAKYHNQRADGGRVFRFFICAYPAITKQEDDDFQFVRME